MNAPLKNIFDLQIKSLHGFEFQDFIVELFLLKYGVNGFIPLRQTHDKGCDGIIISENRIIACYGPNDNSKKNFDKKAEDDFSDFKNNWEQKFPNWSFIINFDITPAHVNKINELKNGALIIGIKQIITIIEKLKNYQRRKLGIYLKIEQVYLVTDYLEEILLDLLREDEYDDIITDYNPKTLIEVGEKIEINYIESDIKVAKEEYSSYMEDGVFTQINNLLAGYEDNEIKKIKRRVIYDYNSKTSGPFNQRLNLLTEIYITKYSQENDDVFLYYIRGFLMYLFEQCLIGNKTQKEK